VASFKKIDELSDSLCSNIRAALGCVNPPQIPLAVETGKRVEEVRGFRIILERSCDVWS
jgi:hypothetical protein